MDDPRDTASPLLDPSAGRPRVAVVSGSYGAGHDAAARELARHLRDAGCEVALHDIATLLPAHAGQVLRWSYFVQLRRCPGTWGTTLSQLEAGRPLHRAVVRLLDLGTRRVVDAVTGSQLVISTHPFASQILGLARERGMLAAPAVTYLTDASVHAMWVHRSVDLHLAIHEEAAGQARRSGGRTIAVQPLVGSPRRLTGRVGADPLAALGVIGPRALVTGGSLGIGELERAAADIVASGVMTPVVACGDNAGLRRRLRRLPGVIALGWRDDMRDVIAACDCVVQNAGGYTSLEALASGVPVLSYRPIPGHGVSNAESLERAGLAPWARTTDDLREALVSSRTAERCSRLPTDAPRVADVLTDPARVIDDAPIERRTGWWSRDAGESVA